MLRLTIAAVAAAALVPAVAAANESRAVAVPAAAKNFDARIARAASDVCGTEGRMPISVWDAARDCRDQVIAEAKRDRADKLARTQLAAVRGTASGGQH